MRLHTDANLGIRQRDVAQMLVRSPSRYRPGPQVMTQRPISRGLSQHVDRQCDAGGAQFHDRPVVKPLSFPTAFCSPRYRVHGYRVSASQHELDVYMTICSPRWQCFHEAQGRAGAVIHALSGAADGREPAPGAADFPRHDRILTRPISACIISLAPLPHLHDIPAVRMKREQTRRAVRGVTPRRGLACPGSRASLQCSFHGLQASPIETAAHGRIDASA